MNEKRFKIISYAQAELLARNKGKFRVHKKNADRDNYHHRKTAGGDIIAELWMIPLERFSDLDYELFHQVNEYIDYAAGDMPCPSWYQEGDVSADW